MLRQAIQGISDLILVPGLINLDFADVKTIMAGMGMAMMGTGIAEGQDRAIEAARRAISSPLLEDASVNGARGVIINVTGGPDMSLIEVNEASCIVQEAADEDANIIFGAVVDPALKGKIKITVIATGFDPGRVAFDGRTGADARGYDGLYRARAHARRTNRPARAARRRSQRRAAHVDPAPLDRRPDPLGRGRLALRRWAASAWLRRAPGSCLGSTPIPSTPTEPDADLDTGQFDVPAFLRRQDG
mgnify:CR=1 FL=1